MNKKFRASSFFVVILSLLLLMFACGRMAQAAPSTLIKSITVDQTINFCAKSHQSFRKGDKGKMLVEGLALIDPELKHGVLVVCKAYGVGFDDGFNAVGNQA